MAIAYLTTGATDFAAGSWSDSTGFATNATLVIESGSQTITSSLDQSAVSGGITYLEVRPTFSGSIGSASAGSLKVDVDSGTDPHVTYGATGGTFYLNAGGGSAAVTRLEVNGTGSMYLTGGTFTNTDLVRGNLNVNESAVLTNAYLMGGNSTIEYNATGLTILDITGGYHTIKRSAATVNISGNATVIFDAVGGSLGSTLLTMGPGSRLILKQGNLPVWKWLGGTLDVSQCKRPSTIAGTSLVVYSGVNGASGVFARGPANNVTWTTANITTRGSYTQQEDFPA